MTQMLELANNYFKAYIKTTRGDIQENILTINENMGNFRRKETFLKAQLEILKLKNEIAKVENSQDGLKNRMEWQSKEAMELKIDQQKLSNMKNIEKKFFLFNRGLQDNIKSSNTYVIGYLKGEDRVN